MYIQHLAKIFSPSCMYIYVPTHLMYVKNFIFFFEWKIIDKYCILFFLLHFSIIFSLA